MLIDEVSLILEGGHGGPGKVSFYKAKKAGPDGGNGGRGGDLYIKATSDLTALNQFTRKQHFTAGNGESGMSNRRFGADGEDLELTLPVGSSLIDQDTGEELELKTTDDRLLVAKGGLGGKGNFEFKSSRNTTPMFAQPGLAGQKRNFKVVLKLIADFGLIGLPNAGKSSLLNELTRAQSKVGAYAFTTLEPNLGVLKRKVMADIPGLIEGASAGKGLGIKFLKHIEKVGLLLHCISAESADPLADYQVVQNELKQYNPDLLNKRELILLTKSDLVVPKQLKQQLAALKKLKKPVLAVSIHDWDSLRRLEQELSL